MTHAWRILSSTLFAGMAIMVCFLMYFSWDNELQNDEILDAIEDCHYVTQGGRPPQLQCAMHDGISHLAYMNIACNVWSVLAFSTIAWVLFRLPSDFSLRITPQTMLALLHQAIFHIFALITFASNCRYGFPPPTPMRWTSFFLTVMGTGECVIAIVWCAWYDNIVMRHRFYFQNAADTEEESVP